MKNTNHRKINTKKLVVLALFCAIAYVTVFALRIGGIGGFLTFDIKDTVITIAAMLFGPISGVVISFVIALFEMISFSSTGPWGALMNFASSAVFAGFAGMVYKYFPHVKKKISGALIGLGGSVFLMTALMLVLNVIITPIYLNVPVETVKELLVPLLLPFNAVKALLNAALVLMLYKPISMAIKRAGITSETDMCESDTTYHFNKRSFLITMCAAVFAVICIVILIVGLGGKFTFWRSSAG